MFRKRIVHFKIVDRLGFMISRQRISLDDHDVGVGKLREMLTLHTNPHAVHGRFTLKDDCERQLWNAGAVS